MACCALSTEDSIANSLLSVDSGSDNVPLQRISDSLTFTLMIE
jgi:hypothetical protein